MSQQQDDWFAQFETVEPETDSKSAKGAEKDDWFDQFETIKASEANPDEEFFGQFDVVKPKDGQGLLDTAAKVVAVGSGIGGAIAEIPRAAALGQRAAMAVAPAVRKVAGFLLQPRVAVPLNIGTQVYDVATGKDTVYDAVKDAGVNALLGEAARRQDLPGKAGKVLKQIAGHGKTPKTISTPQSGVRIRTGGRTVTKAAPKVTRAARVAQRALNIGSKAGPIGAGVAGASLGLAVPMAFLGALEHDANREHNIKPTDNTVAGNVMAALQPRTEQPAAPQMTREEQRAADQSAGQRTVQSQQRRIANMSNDELTTLLIDISNRVHTDRGRSIVAGVTKALEAGDEKAVRSALMKVAAANTAMAVQGRR